MKKFLPIIIAILVIGIYLAYNMYNKEHVETKNATADAILTPAELMTAFDTDEATANTKYLDKIIQVKGKVSAINEVATGGSISLDTGSTMSAIICEFESKDAVAAVKIGDEVTVKGFCTGKLMDVVLVRCSL